MSTNHGPTSNIFIIKTSIIKYKSDVFLADKKKLKAGSMQIISIILSFSVFCVVG